MEIPNPSPGPFGGNLDVRELCAGSAFTCRCSIEAPYSVAETARRAGRWEVVHQWHRMPARRDLALPSSQRPAPLGSARRVSEAAAPDFLLRLLVVVETGVDLAEAARAATGRMIDLLVSHWGFSEVHAYILCSVALRLRLSQVVNEPVHTVSAALAKTNPARAAALSRPMIINDPAVIAELEGSLSAI